MADTPEQQASSNASTNVLLAQILGVVQNILTTSVASLAALHDLSSMAKAQLQLAQTSNEYLKQIADSIGGGGEEHTYTVKVLQLATQQRKKK